MTDPTRPDDFARALLALDDSVGAERYAAYRARLDGLLARESRRRSAHRQSRRRARVILAAALLLLSLGLPAFLAPDPDGAASGALVVLDPPPPRPDAAGPFENATLAGYVAVARSGEPIRAGREAVVPLRVEWVLKDETGAAPPAFCCPADQAPPPGEQLVLYLDHSREAGWTVRDLDRCDDRYEKTVLPGVMRCVELVNAASCADPAARYQQLLAPGRGGLDDPASCVFACRPDPRSADVLLSQLDSCRRRLDPKPRPDGRPEDVAEQLARLAEALSRLHEARAAVPLAECAARLPRDARKPLYDALPALCRNATDEVRSRVVGQLRSEIETAGGREPNPDARRALNGILSTVR